MLNPEDPIHNLPLMFTPGRYESVQTDPMRSDYADPFPSGVDAFVKLPQFGCVVWVDSGTLMGCEEGEFYAAGNVVKANDAGVSYEITAPDSQHFLDRVNFYLGTDFELAAFAGR